MMGGSKDSPALAGLFLAVAASTACYQYRASVVNLTPATERHKTVWPVGWGIFGKGHNTQVDCQGQAMSEVTVKDNFGFTLLTVATLGFLSPKRLEWRCAPPNPKDAPLKPPDKP